MEKCIRQQEAPRIKTFVIRWVQWQIFRRSSYASIELCSVDSRMCVCHCTCKHRGQKERAIFEYYTRNPSSGSLCLYSNLECLQYVFSAEFHRPYNFINAQICHQNETIHIGVVIQSVQYCILTCMFAHTWELNGYSGWQVRSNAVPSMFIGRHQLCSRRHAHGHEVLVVTCNYYTSEKINEWIKTDFAINLRWA